MKISPYRYYNKSELEEDGFVLHSSFEGGSSTKEENQKNKENTSPNKSTSNKYYVNTIVTIPMKDIDIKAKLDWYTTMTDRTVTAHVVRGKQRQSCSTCGYSTWCYKEMCFSSFDSQGNYEKWCADCMAKEMGGHFIPSKELQQERIKKKQEEECNDGSNTTSTTCSSSSSSSSRDTNSPVVPSSPTRYSPPPSTPKSTRRSLLSAPASPSSTSCSSSSSATTMTTLSCHFCQLVLDRVQSTLCVDDEAIGFQCKDCDSGEHYCLECAHDTGGLFCSGSHCGAFLCQQCNHKYSETPSGHVYCSQECMPPPKNNRMWQLEEESGSSSNALDSMALLRKEVMSLLSETTSEVLY